VEKNDKKEEKEVSNKLLYDQEQTACPHCGRKLTLNGGFKLKRCPFCKEPLG